MLVVCFSLHVNILYDSQGAPNTRYLMAVFRYLSDEHNRCNRSPLTRSEWTLVETTPATPQQANSFDCGVFCCAYIDSLLRGEEPSFTQQTVTQYRQWMALSILEGRLPLG